MEIGNLNLARKWRSKNFDQIVGQDLSIKILKNSLYLDRFFPVYLFSGQRGCGKTTTARVFAAAINCAYLDLFRKNPKEQLLPCNECDSCKAMLAGNHPDFIEMDAASHTGVDNVRNIIDAAGFLPVMGRKKIYLIDEAHMLSKAAFNAFLKILEEPPANVLFILATTDSDKIIDTVRSRCFQLFFGAVKNQSLLNHLHAICAEESIKVETEALALIIKEVGGSVRDAINVLERVRFSSSVVTKKAVQELLGHLDDEQVILLLNAVLHKTPADLIMYFKTISLYNVEASYVWRRLMDLLRAAIWLKNGVHDEQFNEYALLLKEVITQCSWMQLNSMLNQLYMQEDVFKRTTAQHAFLEMILLGFCQKYSQNDSSDNNSSPAPAQVSATQAEEYINEDVCEDEDEEDDDEEDDDDDIEDEEGAWPSFIQEVTHLQDPLLTSLFKQAQLVGYEKTTGTIKIAFAKELSFFSDWLNDMQQLWRPLLEKYFSERVLLECVFTLDKQVSTEVHNQPKKTEVVANIVEQKKSTPSMQGSPSYAVQQKQKYQPKQSLGIKVDLQTISALPKAQMLMRHFPGDLYEVQES